MTALLLVLLLNSELNDPAIPILCTLGQSIGGQQGTCQTTYVPSASGPDIAFTAAALGLVGLGVLQVIRNAVRAGD
jgi:hypothetical protein